MSLVFRPSLQANVINDGDFKIEVQQVDDSTAIAGSIIARMAAPGSELASHRWLTGASGLGDLLDVDLAALPLSRLYRASDVLMKHREEIETRLFARIETLFALEASVTLYDLTNTYFEGAAAGNYKAARGRSKVKCRDCPRVTLGVVCDGSGFIRRSRVFPGNAVECRTLEAMLIGLAAPAGAMVTMDRGTTLVSAGEETIQVVRELSEDGQEVRLHCHSPGRELKESGIMARFWPIFHSKEERSDGYLFISVLVYQFVQPIRQRLGTQGIHDSWASLRAVFSVQRRITASFVQRDGRTLHVRKTPRPEPDLAKLYDALGLPHQPGGVQKLIA